MAELDLNYDPAWLQQRPDSNQPMSLAQAFQLRQHKQQIDMQKALLPLRQQELQANLANAALDMKIKQEQTDLALKLKSNDAAGWARAAQITDWADPSQIAPIYEQGGKGGGFTRDFTGFLENMQQNAQMFSAKEAATAARAEAIRDTLATRQSIADQQLQAAKERTDAAIASREKIAEENVKLGREIKEDRAAQAVLRHNRMLLNMGKQVTRQEFITRTINTYVRATGETPEKAAAAVGKIYDEFLAPPDAPGGGAVDPKDPMKLFQMPQ